VKTSENGKKLSFSEGVSDHTMYAEKGMEKGSNHVTFWQLKQELGIQHGRKKLLKRSMAQAQEQAAQRRLHAFFKLRN